VLGFCRDPLSDELHKRGYSLVRLPEASLHARMLMGRKSANLFRLGDLATFFESDMDAPTIRNSATVAPIDVTETGRLDGRLGARIVATILGSNKPELEARLAKTRRFRLKISNISKEYVELGDVDEFLGAAKLKDTVKTIERLMSLDALFVISAVLKTPSVTVESETADQIAGGIGLIEVHSGVSGTVRVQANQRDSSHMLIKSDEPVVFAFQAAKLLFMDGDYKCLDPDLGRYKLLGGNSGGQKESRFVDEVGGGIVSLDASLDSSVTG
jgi:hypothetical protein